MADDEGDGRLDEEEAARTEATRLAGGELGVALGSEAVGAESTAPVADTCSDGTGADVCDEEVGCTMLDVLTVGTDGSSEAAAASLTRVSCAVDALVFPSVPTTPSAAGASSGEAEVVAAASAGSGTKSAVALLSAAGGSDAVVSLIGAEEG